MGGGSFYGGMGGGGMMGNARMAQGYGMPSFGGGPNFGGYGGGAGGMQQQMRAFGGGGQTPGWLGGTGGGWNGGMPQMPNWGGGMGGMGGNMGGAGAPGWMGGQGGGWNGDMSASSLISGAGDVLKKITDTLGLTPGQAEERFREIGGFADSMGKEMSGVNAGMDAAGQQFGKDTKYNAQQYQKRIGANTNAYTAGQEGLGKQSAAASKQFGELYNTNDQSMATLQNRANQNAGQAMSLKDAGNVNNSVASGTRDLYNKEGNLQRQDYNKEGANQESLYEQKAQGVGRQGLADTGVLSALGAQAMAGQMGGAAPMTGGQMAAMQGANMSRAGSAYARAQQQMQGLRDQGMNRNMDMRNQGLGNQSALRSRGVDQGFAQSDLQYGRGQQAQGLASQLTQDRQGMGNAYQGVQQGLRNEQSGYQGNIYGANNQYATDYRASGDYADATTYGLAQDAGARQMGQINSIYQPKMAMAGQLGNLYGGWQQGMMGLYGQMARAAGDAMPDEVSAIG